MLTLAKAIGGPGSIGFLALNCIVGLAIIYVWPRRRALGRWYLFGLYTSYILLGIPALAHSIAAPLGYSSPPIVEPLDAVIVFGGDNSVGRLNEAVRVWKRHSPKRMIVSGEDWFRDRIIESGLPPSGLVWDQVSTTTRDQVEYVRRYATSRPGARIVVICSRLHALRVDALLRAAALDVQVVPAPVDLEPARAGVRVWIPTYAGLRVTRDALYERLALAYYERQGWIALPERTGRTW